MVELILYLLIGVLAGLLAGLLGIGGGIIVVPILDLIFSAIFPESIVMHMAIGTSLAIMIFTTASSAYAYQRHQLILWSLFIKFIPGMVIGTLTGAFIAKYLSNDTLRMAFAVFIFMIALKMFDTRKTQAKIEIPPLFILSIAAFFTGMLSGFFGIGGGSLMVPFFVYCSVVMQNATGTSAACGFVLSIVGTLSLVLTGVESVQGLQIPSGTTGFVYWPAVLPIAMASMACAPLGTKIAVWMPPRILQRCFAVILVLTALYLFFGS